jgi:hypothetical protein
MGKSKNVEAKQRVNGKVEEFIIAESHSQTEAKGIVGRWAVISYLLQRGVSDPPRKSHLQKASETGARNGR